MIKIPFEDGTLVKAGYVEIDGVKYEVIPAEYTGKTPLSAYNLKKMQDNIESDINAKAEEQNTLREDGDLVRKIKISGASKQETREGYNKFNIEAITESNYLNQGNGALGSSTSSNTSDYIPVKANITYTVKYDYETLAAEGKRGYCYFDTNKTYLKGSEYTSNNKTFTLTPTEDGYIRFAYDKNCYDIMFYEGTEEKPYEQYGASPSIEYEAPIESVGDNIQLFDKDKATESYYVNMSTGNLGVSSVSDTSDYIPILKDENYSISFEYETLLDSGARPICLYNTEKKYLSGSTYSITNKKVTITPSENGYLRFSYDKNCTNIKLSEGKTTGAYSPNGQGSIEIYNSNENWFDKNNTSSAIGGASGYVASDYIPAKIGDKIVKSNATTLYFYDSSKTLIQGVSNWKTGTIVIENTAYIRCNVLGTELDTFMLVKNQDLPSEYIQGQSQTKALYTQQPFRAIGDVKDRSVKQNGVWYEEHKINRLVFNGNENWGLDTTKEITQVFKYYNPSLFPEDKVTLLSNYFIDKVSGDNEGITIGYGQCYVAINKSTASTVEEFKAKLTELYNAGTPLYVDYVLATPTLIECTPEQVQVLNDIYSAYGEGMTNIICNDEIEPVIEIVKESKETVQSENDKAISMLLARIEELEKKIQ